MKLIVSPETNFRTVAKTNRSGGGISSQGSATQEVTVMIVLTPSINALRMI